MKQRQKEDVIIRQPIDEVKKEDALKVTFDAEKKSWRGPVKGKLDTLKVTQTLNSREKQLQSQNADSLPHNRKRVQHILVPNLEEDDDQRPADTTDIYSADIEKPFSSSLKDAKGAKWGAQVLPSDRVTVTEFEKPVRKSEEASMLSSKQQVKRLEKQLESKDKDIDLLRQELQKAHRENDLLVEQLKGYRGKHYTDLAKENSQLRTSVDRMNRQLVLIDGEKKKENNSRLQQMELERELEIKHAPEWQRLTMTQQNEEQAKAMEVRLDTREQATE